MKHDDEEIEWLAEAGDPRRPASEMQPPDDLEDRVVATLTRRGLLGRRDTVEQPSGLRILRASFAVGLAISLFAVGFLVGRKQLDGETAGASLTGAETDLYALLLYETEGYDPPDAAEAVLRYGEYSRWVAEARKRRQFVTGEDLDVERGWLVAPSAEGAAVEPATSIGAGAPLSGIFFIRAASPQQALDLTSALPHLRHGGSVIVQKTVPTDSPPE